MNAIDQLCQHLKTELSASQVAGHVLTLKKSGAGQTALCPFHKDSKPSLHVTDSKGFIKCFACGGGGDIIRFWQQYHSLENAGKAAIHLANTFHVLLPEELQATAKSGKKPQLTATHWRKKVAHQLLLSLQNAAEKQSYGQQLANVYCCNQKPFPKAVVKEARDTVKAQLHGKSFAFPELADLSALEAGAIYVLHSGNSSFPSGFMWAANNRKKTVMLFTNEALTSRTGLTDKADTSPFLAVLAPDFEDFQKIPIPSHTAYLKCGFSPQFASYWKQQHNQVVLYTTDFQTAIATAELALIFDLTAFFFCTNTYKAVVWDVWLLQHYQASAKIQRLKTKYLPTKPQQNG